jgi:hypothetical protein
VAVVVQQGLRHSEPKAKNPSALPATPCGRTEAEGCFAAAGYAPLREQHDRCDDCFSATFYDHTLESFCDGLKPSTRMLAPEWELVHILPKLFC